MVWTQPMTFTANTVLTAAQLNVHLRDNMLASEAAIVQGNLDYIVSDGYNQLTRRRVEHNFIETAETTKSTEYTDLTTVGPSVTLETGRAAWVILTAHLQANVLNAQLLMSFAITRPVGPLGPDGEPISGLDVDEGGTTNDAEGAGGEGGDRDPGDNWALKHDGLTANKGRRCSYVDYISANLTPGINTFTCKYRVGSESVTGTFQTRSIIVIPM
jgi:hypothetical protein